MVELPSPVYQLPSGSLNGTHTNVLASDLAATFVTIVSTLDR